MVTIAQFADDTSIGIYDDKINIKNLFKSLDNMEPISGLKINKEKTEIILLGTTNREQLDPEFQLLVKDKIKILGVSIANNKKDTLEANYP